MKKWEFLDTHAALDERNRLGEEGWELVTVTQQQIQSGSAGIKTIEKFYFKREKLLLPRRSHKI